MIIAVYIECVKSYGVLGWEIKLSQKFWWVIRVFWIFLKPWLKEPKMDTSKEKWPQWIRSVHLWAKFDFFYVTKLSMKELFSVFCFEKLFGNIFLIGSPHFNWTCRATLRESNILTEHANDRNITNATNLIAIIWFWSDDFVFWRKSRHAEKPTDNDITRESEWNAKKLLTCR